MIQGPIDEEPEQKRGSTIRGLFAKSAGGELGDNRRRGLAAA